MLNAKFLFYNIPVSDSKNVIICSRGSHSIRGGILFLNETMYSQWAIDIKMKFLVILHVSDHGEKVIFKLLWVSIIQNLHLISMFPVVMHSMKFYSSNSITLSEEHGHICMKWLVWLSSLLRVFSTPVKLSMQFILIKQFTL